MHAWLRAGGVLFGAFGSDDNPDERAEFLGEPMYWSHFDAETTSQLLSGAGFSVVQAEVVEDQGERPLWVIATVEPIPLTRGTVAILLTRGTVANAGPDAYPSDAVSMSLCEQEAEAWARPSGLPYRRPLGRTG